MTIKNKYPLPLISELIDKFKNARYITKMDVQWGFNNIRIKEGDEWKGAFKTSRGLFEPTVMLFGMTNSPATFQTFMNHVLREEIVNSILIVYMDNIFIFSMDLNKHRQVVRQVLGKLRDNGLTIKGPKCEFEVQETACLGLIVGNGKARMDPVKVDAITEWPAPTTKKSLQTFLGFTNFYRRFIQEYADLARPLHALTGSAPWEWKDEQEKSFTELKKRMSAQPILALPNDYRDYEVEMDASDYALGGILSQKQLDGTYHPLAYISKALNHTERNYEIYDKEMLAIMHALDQWRQYLLGAKSKFKIFTDHQNLQYFRKLQKLNRRQARWASELADYDFKLVHRPGKLNGKADALSR